MEPLPSLAALRFSRIEERVYRVVVEHPYCALRELATRCDVPGPIVRAAVDRLAKRNLVSVDHGIVEPVDPQESLTTLVDELGHRTSALVEELSQVSRGISVLSRHYAECRIGSIAIDRLPNDDSVRTLIASIHRRTRTDLRNMQSMVVAPETLGVGQQLTAAALARGVRVRSLYAPNTLAEPQQRDAAAPLRELGSEICSGPTPFRRLLISDHEFALLKAEIDDDPPTFLIREPSLVLTLVNHFDYCWQQGVPALENGNPVSTRQLRMLRLLAAGATDAAVARECGVSPRQLTRELADLMARTHTSTRFSLAVEAARRGWT